MLPDDAVLKGRLFRAARVLLHWNQAHLAARADLDPAVADPRLPCRARLCGDSLQRRQQHL